jgi:hypothetical protein
MIDQEHENRKLREALLLAQLRLEAATKEGRIDEGKRSASAVQEHFRLRQALHAALYRMRTTAYAGGPHHPLWADIKVFETILGGKTEPTPTEQS